MLRFVRFIFPLVLVCLTATTTHGGIINFDFAVTGGATNQAGADLDGLATGTTSVTANGITVTLTAIASSGVFNQTGDPNFGINADPSGDLTDAFDNGAGVTEEIGFFLTSSSPAIVEFVSIDLDRLTVAGEAASLVFAGGSTFTVTPDNTTGGLFTLDAPETVTSDQLVTFGFLSGGGFGLERITLNVTAIPEPSSAIMLMMCAVFGTVRRRRR